MNEIIRKLFLSNGFVEMDSVSGVELYGEGNIDKKNYWVVIESEPDLIEAVQESIQDEIVRRLNDPAFEKNANILCLWNVPEINEVVKRAAHKAEEDPFFFKKHVLYYTESELNSFKSQFQADEFFNAFGQALVDKNIFSQYKDLYGKEGWQVLLYRIAIKASFIKIREEEKESIDDLEKSVATKISSLRNDKMLFMDFQDLLLNDGFQVSDSPDENLDNILSKLRDTGYEL
ncbi:ABC-three component system middle component 1 [Marinobacter sp. GN3S48]|uniref:ABC-three component system middle component 1 n=1 Tax=Marinobacter sp. GN3S48 TaxID=3382302 RepID=UPI00387AE147